MYALDSLLLDFALGGGVDPSGPHVSLKPLDLLALASTMAVPAQTTTLCRTRTRSGAAGPENILDDS